MKKQLFFLAVLIWLGNTVIAQDTIVKWTFPSTSADSLMDGGLALNSSRYISAQYGTWGAPSYLAIALDYTTNGSLGAPDKCAKATGWNDGADSAFWMVKFKTTGYTSLKLFSKQQAGGSNPGPKDWKVQYKLSGSNVWNDITGGTITCANDWTSGVLNGIDIPSECDNQSSSVSIRWIMTSNLDINGATVLATGICKIDDIIVTGTSSSAGINEAGNTIFSLYPNPNKTRSLNIVSTKGIKLMRIYNLQGQLVQTISELGNYSTISLEMLKAGVYFLRAEYIDDTITIPSKLIIE